MSQQQAEVGLQEEYEMSEQSAEKKTGLELMREPFPPNQISKLPKGTKEQNGCAYGLKKSCKVCGGFHHPDIIHLDYVGHAALTDRLLDADPNWSWEPLAFTNGLPAFDEKGGLWIRLTVCGVSRIGYGNAENKTYMDVGSREKEVIGDALRNAAMRFGAALDLWHKGQLHVEEETEEERKKREDEKKGTPWTKELLDLAKEAVKGGMPAYTTFWKSLSDEARSVLVQTDEHKEFKKQAAAVKVAA